MIWSSGGEVRVGEPSLSSPGISLALEAGPYSQDLQRPENQTSRSPVLIVATLKDHTSLPWAC